jgi:hypothetical protein
MSIRLASFVALPVVLAAAGFALIGDRSPDAEVSRGSTSTPMANPDEVLPSENSNTLPPNHPPIGEVPSPRGSMLPPDHPAIAGGSSPHGSMPSATTEASTLVWKVPSGWQESPNPNAMRLATYRAPGGVEVSVSRAGGSTDANIQRWIAQFDDVGRDARTEKTVHGLHVVMVDVTGTYVGGGMTMGNDSAARPGRAMVGAIVEGRGLPYFFKMMGPAAAVLAAHPAFDRLVDGISPT